MARPPKARLPIKIAALQLFVESGVHATGIREIAKHAGCSEAALYRHWANKEALVGSLYREHLAEVNRLLEEAISGQSTLEAKVRAAATAVYKLYDEHPLVFRFVLLVQHELAKHLEAGTRTPHGVVVDLCRWAAERGEAKGDPVLHAAALTGIFLNTATYVLYGRLPGPLLRYVEPVTKTALLVLKQG
jgi:AcrR family transcriptional regulator